MFNMQDAQAALGFAQNQLTYIEPGVYRQKYRNADYRRHVPVVTEGPEWAPAVAWNAMDYTGRAKFLNGASTDMPFIGVNTSQFTANREMLGTGYQWNIQEVGQAQLLGINLGAEKPAQAMRANERLIYDIAVVGAAEKNWFGFTNDPGVASYTVAATGTGNSTYFANKTPDQVVADFNTLLNGIMNATGQIEAADTVRLPPSAMQYLVNTRIGQGTDTILDFVKKANIYTANGNGELDIQGLVELEAMGSGGRGRMVAYRKDPEVLRLDLPMPSRSAGLERSRSIMSYEGGFIAVTGGMQIRLPAAVRYADGISDGSAAPAA